MYIYLYLYVYIYIYIYIYKYIYKYIYLYTDQLLQSNITIYILIYHETSALLVLVVYKHIFVLEGVIMLYCTVIYHLEFIVFTLFRSIYHNNDLK